MLRKLTKENRGFTIIEVLIVLAIAGLIMIIIFIAVPALQRSQRNETRNNDARLIFNAVNECLSNHNGVETSCNAIGGTPPEVVLPANLKTVTAATYGVGAGTITAATWVFAATCAADGQSTVPATTREFAVRYQVETTGVAANRCISG
jgi:prepilin-type N-terminal cleavage/methylation domain-containing protein